MKYYGYIYVLFKTFKLTVAVKTELLMMLTSAILLEPTNGLKENHNLISLL